MSATTGERAAIPQQRGGQEIQLSPRGEVAPETNETDAAERHREALRRALGLTADQLLTLTSVTNVRFVNREGRSIGGAMVVNVTIDGPDTDNPSRRHIDITDDFRGGLDEETITELGAQAQQ